jgi:hypothetical protein
MDPVARDELISTIAYAIGRNTRLLPREGDHLSIEGSRLLAEAIVKHLKLCRLDIRRPPPGPGHSTPG